MILAHHRNMNLQHNFKDAYDNLYGKGMVKLATQLGTTFVVHAEITKKGNKEGQPVLKFYQGNVEYSRAYECCWGHSTNCNRTVIGMYCNAVDRYLGGKGIDPSFVDQLEPIKPHNRSFPVPTVEDQYKYLLRLYFGNGADWLDNCIQRAYLDFNRTLHGISSQNNGNELRQKAEEILHQSFEELPSSQIVIDQTSYDRWHENLCNQLCEVYRLGGFSNFNIGQAQKWINMTMKYIFTVGELTKGYERFFQLAHIPIDNIMLEKLLSYGVPKLSRAWSRIVTYHEYMNFQNWLRKSFPDSAPLSVEFHLWQIS